MNFDDAFCDDDVWDNDANASMNFQNNASFRNQQYSNAYGDYRGGYGPSPPGPPMPMFGPRFGPGGGGPGPFGPPGRNGSGGGGPGPFGPPGRNGSGSGGPGLFGPPRRNGSGGPPRPHGPPFGSPRGPAVWGRGFGPRGPPAPFNASDNRARQYLLRCGVPKNSLKNLPRELLDLIEPQYCGLCGLGFDSFSLSKIHYLSKNHLKNHKKWMTQKLDMGMLGPQEAPLRSRELYCELCDVHITSKVHADSHYSGKSHRSIVLGHKPPKNPVLVQGVDRRVNQLIRREKKFLPKLDTEKNISSPDPKNVSPDLHCEICKTCVTNSEQMRMHLNGKRHLTKEKQHILRTMRGDLDDEPSAAAEDNDNVDEETNVEPEDATKQESGDWNEEWE